MRSIFWLLFCTVCAVPASAWQGAPAEIPKPGGVQGRVVDARSGDPVKKAVVFVLSDGDNRAGAYSNADGGFSILHLPPGPYRITVQRDGFVADSESESRVLTIKPGAVESDI